jgi:hypothetical protein
MNTGGWLGGLLVVGACLGGGALSAQEAPSEGDRRHGGFGAPVVKFTEIDSRFGVLVGGRGGWIIDGSIVIGGGGYALANGTNFEHVTNGAGDPGGIEMGYGGLELGYVLRPDERVHLSLGLLIGGGGLAWEEDSPGDDRADDAFFVAEPEVDAVVNVTRSFRVGVGVSYRLARGVELLDLRDGDVSGLAAVLAFNFGGF